MFERVGLLVQPRVQLRRGLAEDRFSCRRQVLDRVRKVQNPHRIRPQHIHQALLPLGTILHGAHDVGRLGPTVMRLHVRLVGERRGVRQA